MTELDLLTIDPSDCSAVSTVVERLRDRLTSDDSRQLLHVLDAWNRKHDAAMNDLATSPEWSDILEWRDVILRITSPVQPEHVTS